MTDFKVILWILPVALLLLVKEIWSSSLSDGEKLPPPCFSDIYCHGRLLDTIQMAKIYPDSKTFVDMKLKLPPNETLKLFDEFMENFPDTRPSRGDVLDFVHENFDAEGQEFEDWTPNDWIEHPSFVDLIADPEFQDWGLKLNSIWKILGRKMKDEVQHSKDLYSIIWVPNPVIVPGGRFREFYYWDSYWIVQGLLLSEMNETVKGILENFLYIINTHGHIPNGGRIYYLARSQPPLLTPMVKLYLDFTNDTKFLEDHIDTLEREFEYWMKNHTVNIEKDGKNYTLAIFGDKSHGPRPESYSEDVEIAATFKDQVKKEAFYSELKAAAESGWDFSSRWFISNATNRGNLTNIHTRSIVPVDLNAVIYWNADLLREFYTKLNNTQKAEYYKKKSEEFLEAVNEVLWHEEVGSWLDYDLQNKIKRDYFYPSNLAPLWSGCYKEENKNKIVRLVLKYLQNQNIMTYPGGIPTTFEHTGEQWDFPNAWPPLQHLMIVGLNNTGDASAVRLAFEIAEKWVRSNYQAFKETEAMYEKYDATVPGGHGGGGEYELQLGFGWSNGIIMDLLYRYPQKLRVEDPAPTELPLVDETTPIVKSISPSTSSSSQITLIAVLVSLTAGFIGICIYKRRTKQTLAATDKRKPSTARYTELKNIPKNKISRYCSN